MSKCLFSILILFVREMINLDIFRNKVFGLIAYGYVV